jgi:hypothetical protein
MPVARRRKIVLTVEGKARPARALRLYIGTDYTSVVASVAPRRLEDITAAVGAWIRAHPDVDLAIASGIKTALAAPKWMAITAVVVAALGSAGWGLWWTASKAYALAARAIETTPTNFPTAPVLPPLPLSAIAPHKAPAQQPPRLTGKIISDAFLYTTPSIRNEKTERLHDGENVTVLRKVTNGDGYDFYYISCTGFAGWVLATMVTLNQ